MKQVIALLAAIALTGSSATFAAQPNMEAALVSLEQARASLEKATADKGGHRVKAIKAVDEAIARVKAGIEYAKTH
ncbi:hypothetical protein HLB44_08585 [Aquincola sp. S2]|uniref:DUF4398 domain-containing protein n=1 Tax=Pseudaquabacterium terrae TaxID=2732868 RepID=A0ABX2EEJ6_9BURK|nr:hypothetical protein [Aquabacterium terrae]NRF67035.1 hypothetical protein [Aquabacterium terrae]